MTENIVEFVGCGLATRLFSTNGSMVSCRQSDLSDCRFFYIQITKKAPDLSTCLFCW